MAFTFTKTYSQPLSLSHFLSFVCVFLVLIYFGFVLYRVVYSLYSFFTLLSHTYLKASQPTDTTTTIKYNDNTYHIHIRQRLFPTLIKVTVSNRERISFCRNTTIFAFRIIGFLSASLFCFYLCFGWQNIFWIWISYRSISFYIFSFSMDFKRIERNLWSVPFYSSFNIFFCNISVLTIHIQPNRNEKKGRRRRQQQNNNLIYVFESDHIRNQHRQSISFLSISNEMR